MYIYIDESGSFTSAPTLDSWCVVAAYVSPETDEPHIRRLIRNLRAPFGGREVKLPDISEQTYFEFLHKLAQRNGLAFAVATDAGLQTPQDIEMHRNSQAAKVVEHKDKMLYETGRESLQKLSDDIRALPLQLYTQLMLQLQLFHTVLERATLFYAQRRPPTLAKLSWRLDRKDTILTAYENAFMRVLPAILQSMSINNPMRTLSDWADYSYFRRFDFKPGEKPDYLQTVYGLPAREDSGANLKMMVTEDFQLVDSDAVPGVQVADLVAGGVRRLLRGGFKQPDVAARLLGSIFCASIERDVCVNLGSLGRHAPVSDVTARLLSLMSNRAKPVLKS